MQNDYYNKKNDQGKTDWSLIPWRAIESAARIMTIAIAPKEQGGKGYGLASWRDVPEGYYRYWAAMIRHIIRRFVYNEVVDQESGEPHMSHVICNAAFVFQKDLEEEECGGNIDTNFYCRKQKKEAEQPPLEGHKGKLQFKRNRPTVIQKTTYDNFIKEAKENGYTKEETYKEYMERAGRELNEPTQTQLPHDRDFQTTYEDSIRQMEFAFDYAKPEPTPAQLICIKCGVNMQEHLRSQELYPECMHLWKLTTLQKEIIPIMPGK